MACFKECQFVEGPLSAGVGLDKSLNEVLDSCKNPRMKSPVTPVDKIVSFCADTAKILEKEPNVVEVKAVRGDKVFVFGDVHGNPSFVGQLDSFVASVLAGKPNGKVLFLGDYVDRGAFGVEVMLLLMLLKIRAPNNVFLIRGNHECEDISTDYGFRAECRQKFEYENGETVFRSFTQMFSKLPLGILLEIEGKKFFCVHGGISSAYPTLESINKADRYRLSAQDNSLGSIHHMLWNDPEKIELYSPNYDRGVGEIFGEKATRIFLDVNGITAMIRAHQMAKVGSYLSHSDKVITIFSCPNYMGRCMNLGGVLVCNLEVLTSSEAASETTSETASVMASEMTSAGTTSQELASAASPEIQDTTRWECFNIITFK